MTKAITEILDDPCTSYWLKDALRTALERDIVDALNDTAVLNNALMTHYNSVTGWTEV